MLNKVEYWLDLAADDVLSAKTLLDGKRYLHAGFFCHLIAEKALKAVIANATSEIPPYIHNLIYWQNAPEFLMICQNNSGNLWEN